MDVLASCSGPAGGTGSIFIVTTALLVALVLYLVVHTAITALSLLEFVSRSKGGAGVGGSSRRM